MPLARLSIKAALGLARTRVSVRHNPNRTWSVRSFLPDGSEAVGFDAYSDKSMAAIKQREQRIFIALLYLGVEHTDALPIALRAVDDSTRAAASGRRARPWRALVAREYERLSLAGKVQ